MVSSAASRANGQRPRAPLWSYVLLLGSVAFLAWDFSKNPDFLPPIFAGVSAGVVAAGCGALISLGVIAYRHWGVISIHAKRAALVIVVLLALAIYKVMSSVVVTGSGGIGAVSAGLSEAVLEFLALSVLVCLFFYWRHRRQERGQPDPSTTRA